MSESILTAEDFKQRLFALAAAADAVWFNQTVDDLLAHDTALRAEVKGEQSTIHIQESIRRDDSLLMGFVEQLDCARAELRKKMLAAGQVPAVTAQPPVMVDGFPRRSRMDLMVPAELAICGAVEAVEKAGCDLRLTDAVILLARARDKVADFVERRHHAL
jgi:hypothetical protein